MRIELTKRQRVKLWMAAKVGYIDTLDFPELFYKDNNGNLFFDLLRRTGTTEEEQTQTNTN